MMLLRTRTMTNEVDKHMNNANEAAMHQNNCKLGGYAQEQWQMMLLSTRTMANEGGKHKNNDK